MPYTEKQKRLFRAVAHGWKPSRIKGPSQKVAKKITQEIKKKGLARGGPLNTGFRTAGPGPRASRGALGILGSPASVGGLGLPSGASGGFGTRAGRPTGGALEGSPLTGPRVASSASLRPRPGRGVNPLLATAGIPYHEAGDRLSSLRRRLS
jgi:hypothetical protein